MNENPVRLRNCNAISNFFAWLTAGAVGLAASLVQADAPSVTTYNTAGSGTWTCPAGVNLVQVEVWGGGGGGGAAWKNGKNSGAGGGGGGAYACLNVYNVTPSTGYAYSVGNAGSGGIDNSSVNTPATAGTDSWFINNTILDALGGNPGTNATGTSAVANGAGGNAGAVGTTGNIQFAGGTGAASAGNPPSAGGGGGSGGYSGAGGNASGSSGGAAGGTDGGAGGNGASPTTSISTGTTPGGGGGGGRDTSGSGSTGAAGGAGQLKFTYFVTPTAQSSAVVFSGISSSSLTISWTRGNGANCIVLVNTNSAVNAFPSNGTDYTASATYGGGSSLGSGNFVVYQGTGNSVVVSGLAAGTTVSVAVMEFSGLGSPLVEYLTNSPATGSQATLGAPTPTVTATTISGLSLASVSLGATVTANNGSAITDYGILWGTAPNLATAGTKISAGSSLSSFPASFTVSVSGLPAGTNIYYCGYATSSAGTGYSTNNTFVYSPALNWAVSNGTLDVNDTTNLVWKDGVGSATYYQDADQIRFGDNGSGTVTLNTTINPGSLTVSNNVSAYTITGSGAIGGAISLVKLGTNTLNLATTNTYTGGTTNSAGTLVLGNASALGTGPLILNGGNLDSAVANLVDANSNAEVWNANFTFVGSQNLNLGTGSILLGSSPQLTVASNTLTIDGLISGPGQSLTVAGAGTLVFSNFNTYSGGTTVNGGVLALQVNSVGGTGDIVGSLTVNSGAQVQSGNYWSLGYAKGYVTNIVLNGGTLNFTGPNSYTQDTGFAGTNLTMTGATIEASNGGSGFDFYAGSGSTQTTYVNVLPSPVPSVISCQTDLRLGSSGSLVFNVAGYGNGNDLLISGSILQATANKLGGAIVKNGAGVMTLSATNTTTSSINVNGGTLLINGQVASTQITVGSDATLGGTNGVMLGSVDVQAGGTFSPVGFLTVSNNLTLEDGSTTVVPINAATGTNAVVNGMYYTGYGGTLVVTKLAGTPMTGQQFQLFNTSYSGGNFSSISGASGVTYSFDPSTGILTVVSGATPSVTLASSFSGGSLVLTWPNGQGWQLQAQTNSLSVGLSTNWVNVTGATSPFTNAVNPANGAVFYQLVSP